MRFGARECGDALHEVEDGGRRMPFLAQYRCQDRRGLGLAEAATAKERLAVLVGARDDRRARRA